MQKGSCRLRRSADSLPATAGDSLFKTVLLAGAALICLHPPGHFILRLR
jgi:hypothetical protein